ncbi:MAG: hypothetical protein QOD69_3010, partial [Solirubrobacteraceae bacterium]|nr:hypothetical protein [Solirubrobacteraceae bacterium]
MCGVSRLALCIALLLTLSGAAAAAEPGK